MFAFLESAISILQSAILQQVLYAAAKFLSPACDP